MEVVFSNRDSFLKRLNSIAKKGGQAKNAALEVHQMILLMQGASEWKPKSSEITHHGETRIKSCIKYDLPGAFRFITVQEKGCILALFFGDHGECDRYLDEHKGLRFIVNKDTKKIEPVYIDIVLAPAPIKIIPDYEKPLLDFVSEKVKDSLQILQLPINLLANLTKISSEAEIENALKDLEESDEIIWGQMIDLVENIRQNCLEAYVDSLLKKTTPMESLDASAIKDITKSISNIGSYVAARDLTTLEWNNILNGDFEDWMLFLHVDQKNIVYADYNGPILLRGISGSGKTSIILHRALYLAEKYPNEKVAILTLNPSLARLLSSLVRKMNKERLVTDRISILSLVEIEKLVLSLLNVDVCSNNLLTSYAESGEKFFLDFFREPKIQKKLAPIINSLRDSYGIAPENYIHNEFVFVAGSFKDIKDSKSILKERNVYKDPSLFPRKGRSVPFSTEWRSLILDCLETYEKQLKDKNIEVPFFVAKKVHAHIDNLIDKKDQLRFRSILVDESQDLSSMEIELLKTFSTNAPNALFFAGDLRQQIFPKTNDFKAAGVFFEKQISLKKNYRNPKEILQAGITLLLNYEADIDDKEFVEVLSPEFSIRQSAIPLVIRAKSSLHERLCHVELVRSHQKRSGNSPICIIECDVTEGQINELQKIKEIYAQNGLEVELLHDSKKISGEKVYLADIDTIKGFEFSIVIISNCESGKVPSCGLPSGEYWRDARRLYVAMTRARDELVFTHTNEPSLFLNQMRDVIQFSDTAEQGFDFHESEILLKLQHELDHLRAENEKLKRSEAYLSRSKDRYDREWINYSKDNCRFNIVVNDFNSIKSVALEIMLLNVLEKFVNESDLVALYKVLNEMSKRLAARAIQFSYNEESSQIEISVCGKSQYISPENLHDLLGGSFE